MVATGAAKAGRTNGPSRGARAVTLGSRGSRRRRQAPRIRSAETAVGSGVTRPREGRPASSAVAMRRGRCVRSGIVRRCVIVVGGLYGTINRSPSVLSTQPLAGMAPTRVHTMRSGSDSVRTDCTHPDRGHSRIARKRLISRITRLVVRGLAPWAVTLPTARPVSLGSCSTTSGSQAARYEACHSAGSLLERPNAVAQRAEILGEMLDPGPSP